VTIQKASPPPVNRLGGAASLYHLLDPEILAHPYPLYGRLRRDAPVLWDLFLHSWVITRYKDVVRVLHDFSAERSPSPEQLTSMGLASMNPIAQVMIKQMLFLDPPAHTRLRGLACRAFTPHRIQALREHIVDIANGLLDAVIPKGHMDVISDFAAPLPAIVTAEMLGVPAVDHARLKSWSADFAEMLGNFQQNPDRFGRVLGSLEEMTAYFHAAICEQREHPRGGLISAFLAVESEGDRLSEEEIIANLIITMVGGQETTTNLIGNGTLTLLRHPVEMQQLRSDLALIPSAIEELLRYESPTQYTARQVPDNMEMEGKKLRKGDAVIAVIGAANRDPERFPNPDCLDLNRKDNRHLAFGWAAHSCFGAPLARLEGQIAFETLLQRLPDVALERGPIEWRQNLALRGLMRLPVVFTSGMIERVAT